MSERGQLGETLAGRYLVRRGWKIVARNWSGAGGELDIVAVRAGVLAFVEVKSRAEAAELDDPIRFGQRGRMINAARLFVACHPQLAGASARFDVVAIDLRRRRRRVDHIPDAFEMDESVDTPSSPNSRNSGYATDRNERR
jgi:putative endonuclease